MAWLPAAFAALRCARVDPGAPLAFLSEAEAAKLSAFADAVLPPDGSTLGAVAYLDRLLEGSHALIGALQIDVPLDRLSERAWKLRLFGSDGVEGGGPNDAIIGKQIGLRQQVREACAVESFDKLSADQRELVAELITQAAFASPIYGGNTARAGWTLIGSRGAVMPEGFTAAEVSQPEPGVDANPIDPWTKQLLTDVATATGGQVAK